MEIGGIVSALQLREAPPQSIATTATQNNSPSNPIAVGQDDRSSVSFSLQNPLLSAVQGTAGFRQLISEVLDTVMPGMKELQFSNEAKDTQMVDMER